MSLTSLRDRLHKLVWIIPTFAGIFALSILIGASPFTGGGAGGGPSDSRGGSQLLGRINGQEVTQTDFVASLEGVRNQFQQFSQGPVTLSQQAEFPRFAYESLLQEYAVTAAAKAAGVTATPSEARSTAEADVEQTLKTRGEGLTQAEYAEFRSRMLAGIDIPTMQRRLTGQKLQEKIQSEARPIEMRVAHVLIKADGRTEEQAEKLAQDVARQARAGADFAKLAAQYSQDEGSKGKGGVVGWASASPPPPDPKGKIDPEAATSFVPEFTAAALRLKVNQISDPVKSQFGYHVLKALAEREYQPTDADAKKDPKKRQERVNEYRSSIAGVIFQGLIAEYRAKAKVDATSPWLKGYLAEQKLNEKSAGAAPKPADEKVALAPVLTAYQEALDKKGPEVDVAFQYKLAQLYNRAGQTVKAQEILEKAVAKRPNAELAFALGETLEKLQKKTDAVAAYQKALDQGFGNPTLFSDLAERFKKLGRTDLAAQAEKKHGELLAKQMADQKKREAEQKAMMDRMIKEQKEKEAAEKAAKAAEAARAPAAAPTPPAAPGTTPGAATPPPATPPAAGAPAAAPPSSPSAAPVPPAATPAPPAAPVKK